MKRRKPAATHKLANGWVINEYHSRTKTVFCENPANGDRDELARFVAVYNRRHQAKIMSIHHLIGTTEEDQKRSLNTAKRWAARPSRFPLQGLWARYRDPWFPGKYFYQITVGDPVDEVSAFERLRRGLHTDDLVDLEFQSIVQRMSEVTA